MWYCEFTKDKEVNNFTLDMRWCDKRNLHTQLRAQFWKGAANAILIRHGWNVECSASSDKLKGV